MIISSEYSACNSSIIIRAVNNLTVKDFSTFSSYFKLIQDKQLNAIVDLSAIEAMQLSGLGMLLMLKDVTDNLKTITQLILPPKGTTARLIIEVAKFDESFLILPKLPLTCQAIN